MANQRELIIMVSMEPLASKVLNEAAKGGREG